MRERGEEGERERRERTVRERETANSSARRNVWYAPKREKNTMYLPTNKEKREKREDKEREREERAKEREDKKTR